MIFLQHNSACNRRQREASKIDLWLSINDHSHIEDCYIFVSCIFDAKHENEARDKIKELSKNNKVYVVGCFPDAFPNDVFPNVKMHSLFGFDKFLDDTFGLTVPLTSLPNNISDNIPITSGCTWNCAYCAIKHGVGNKLISNPIAKIDQMIDEFTKENNNTLLLSGEDTGLWGIDCNQPFSQLTDLLKTKHTTFAFDNMTTEMFMINFDSLMDLVNLNKLVQITVGLQHFDNYVLSTMNRPEVDISKFVEAIKKLREKNVTVVVYLMCNFPSETRQHVEIQIEGIKTLKRMGVTFCLFNFHRKLNTNIPFADIDLEVRKKHFHEVFMATQLTPLIT